MDGLDWGQIDQLILLALQEDLGAGDITSQATVPEDARAVGQIVAKKGCVAAGLFLVERVYAATSEDIEVELLCSEGAKIAAGTPVCRLAGSYRALLAGERTVLNFIQRTCGIATLTSRFVKAAAGTTATIYDTRKTCPGFRSLDKYAVRAGGGANHRMGLYDAILIKENHVAAAGSVASAIESAREPSGDVPLHVEVRNFEELVLAVEYGADVVMLDNMSRPAIAKAVALVGDRVELEVSGGVTVGKVKGLAQTGVPRISVGALTHSAPASDLTMLIIPKRNE